MGKQDKDTGISWCDFTFNLWDGCFKISPGCKNCYAAELDKWLRKGEHWGAVAPRRFFGDDHWKKPLAWNRAARRAGRRMKVFCSSVCDWAEIHPVREINAKMDYLRSKMWSLIAQTEWLDWLLLTKRIENVSGFLPKAAHARPDWPHRYTAGPGGEDRFREWSVRPWPNVWLGATIEDHEHAQKRLPLLMEIPAAVHFGSYEPALGAIDWAAIEKMPELVIFGDESGRKRRPAELEWARQTRDACIARGSAFHFKQWCGADAEGLTGARDTRKKIHLPVLDGVSYKEFPHGA
jgi:protein gp37